MRKIALLTPMLQPYRLTFYEKLSKINPNTKWLIFHGVKRTEDGRPAYSGKANFDNIGLVEIKYRIGPFTLLIHKGLVRELKRFDPDMIIIQAITGNLSYRRIVSWGSSRNKTIVNWTCAWDPGLAKGALLGFKNMLVSTFFKKGDAFLTYSTKAIEYVMNRGINYNKITVCYNGIEIDDLLRREKELIAESEIVRYQLQLNGSIVFLYVGGLLEDKKVDLLIDAFKIIAAENENVRLLIIGDGPLKQFITNKINLLNDKRINYLGRIIDDVDPYFAASTCLVLPGAGGLALNQAMFWRKICIAGEADGTEDDLVLDGKTGFRFEKDNLSDLVRVMNNVLYLDDVQLKEMGEQAREIILKKSNVNKMVDVFAGTVGDFFPEIRSNSN